MKTPEHASIADSAAHRPGAASAARSPTARQLEVFRAVMQLGSATKAASALHVSQPSITQVLAQLEAQCGFALFERRQGQLQPTAQAHHLKSEVDGFLAGLQAVSQRIDALRTTPEQLKPPLRVGCLHAFASAAIGPVMAAFRAQHPAQKVTLMVESSRNIRDALFAGSLDFGLLADETDLSGLAASPFYQCAATCVLPATHALAAGMASVQSLGPAELQGQPMIALSVGDTTQGKIEASYRAAGVAWDCIVRTPYSATQCELVAAGCGVAITNPMVASRFEARGLVCVPYRPTVLFEAWLAFAPLRTPSAAAQDFLALCRQWQHAWQAARGTP